MLSRIALFFQERMFVRAVENSYVSSESNLSAHKDLVKIIKRKKIKSLNKIANVNYYISVCSYDSSVGNKFLIISKNDWGKKLFARVLALIIFEFLDDINSLFTKSFRGITEKLSSTEQLNKLNKILKKIYSYRKINIRYFKEIRNNVFGHRDLDAESQIKYIDNINVKKIGKLTLELSRLILEYISWATEFYETLLRNLKKNKLMVKKKAGKF